MNLPVEIYSVESVRRIDQSAIQDAGISGYALMTRAAQAALDETRSRFPDATRWQLVCGPGNNGGDGYVLARLAAQQGIAVSVIALTPSESLQGDAQTACLDFSAEGGVIAAWSGELDANADLLVDGLLGNGLQRDVSGAFADVIDAMNRHDAPVVALDIPSGLHGDSGAIMGCAVRADLTVTFVGLKAGLFLGAAPDCVGELAFADLAIPEECRRSVAVQLRRMDDALLRDALPARPRDAHKGHFGHLLLVGGGPGMSGAIRLAGMAALRSGAGRVSVATHPASVAAVAAGAAELMVHGISGASGMEALLDRVDTVAIGPGLGTDEWAKSLLALVLQSTLPSVLDADALNLLPEFGRAMPNQVLTPHPGEAARLLGVGVAEVQADRMESLAALRGKFGGTVVLKGANTLVSAAEGPPRLCTAGNPGMATAGMGDVLTGVIAGLLAQKLDPEQAAVCGVLAQALAGDRAARAGQRGLTASDVIGELRAVLNP